MSYTVVRHIGIFALLISLFTVFGALNYDDDEANAQIPPPPPPPVNYNLNTYTILSVSTSQNTLGNTVSEHLTLFQFRDDVRNDDLEALFSDTLTVDIHNSGLSTTSGSNNTLTFSADTRNTKYPYTVGTFTITINNPSFFGTDVFTYTVTDTRSGGGTATGTVNVRIGDPPLNGGLNTHTSLSVSNAQNTLGNTLSTPLDLYQFRDGARDAGLEAFFSDTLTVDIHNSGLSITSGSNNTLAFSTSTRNTDSPYTVGTFTITINNPSFSGTDVFTYTVTDTRSGGGMATGTVNVRIGDPPLNGDLTYRDISLSVSNFQNTLDNTLSTPLDLYQFRDGARGAGLEALVFDILTVDIGNNGVSTTSGSNNTLAFSTSTRNTDSPYTVGSFTITINNPSFSGTDVFTYTSGSNNTLTFSADTRNINSRTIDSFTLTINNPSFFGTDVFTYTVSHTDGSQTTGDIRVEVAEDTLTIMNILLETVILNESGTFDFTETIIDGRTIPLSDITITITSASTSTPPVNITDLLTFTPSEDVTANGDGTVTINAQTINFTINANAQVGHHAFTYTATAESANYSSAGTITFPIALEAPVCTSNVVKNFELGQIGIGSISKMGTMVVANTGNTPITALDMSAGHWIGDINGTATEVINSEQTRYSLVKAHSYADRTSFTGTPTSMDLMNQDIPASGDVMLPIYMQVLPIINAEYTDFRGAINQVVTVSARCE